MRQSGERRDYYRLDRVDVLLLAATAAGIVLAGVLIWLLG